MPEALFAEGASLPRSALIPEAADPIPRLLEKRRFLVAVRREEGTLADAQAVHEDLDLAEPVAGLRRRWQFLGRDAALELRAGGDERLHVLGGGELDGLAAPEGDFHLPVHIALVGQYLRLVVGEAVVEGGLRVGEAVALRAVGAHRVEDDRDVRLAALLGGGDEGGAALLGGAGLYAGRRGVGVQEGVGVEDLY